jgi:hypothetical protein
MCPFKYIWLAHIVELEHLGSYCSKFHVVNKMPQKSKEVIFKFFDKFVIHIPKDENWL